MEFSFRDSIGQTFTIGRGNLLGHGVPLPKFENADASELCNSALELVFIQGGTSTWSYGHNFYTKWAFSREKGPYLSHVVISTDDTPKTDRTEFHFDREADWHGHDSIPMMRTVLRLLLARKKKNASDQVPSSFEIKMVGIPLCGFGWNLDRPLHRLLEKIDAHPEASSIRLVWYMFPDFANRTETNYLNLGQITVPSDGLCVDFCGQTEDYLEIKAPEGTYKFSDQFNYGTFKNPMNGNRLQFDSCGFTPTGPSYQYGWIMSSEYANRAIALLEKIIGLFPK